MSDGTDFIHTLQQEGVIRAVWGVLAFSATAIWVFFFKEVYYAPARFVGKVDFDNFKNKDFKDFKEDIKEDIQKNEQNVIRIFDKIDADKKDSEKRLEKRDNDLKEFIKF